MDKAGSEYWTQFWKDASLPSAINFSGKSIHDYPYRILDKKFRKAFSGYDTKEKLILEIGCGNSAFLSYFHQAFGFQVHGLDYSEHGCMMTRKILERDKVPGEIRLGDAFNPDTDWTEKFDVVGSFGVVEHFDDTSGTLRSFSSFLKPGGLLITSLPNLAGLAGMIQRTMNKPVYDIHVPLTRERVSSAIRSAGLDEIFTDYYMSVDINVNLEGIDGKSIPATRLKKMFLKPFRYGSKAVCYLEHVTGELPTSRLFSAGVFSVARKK